MIRKYCLLVRNHSLTGHSEMVRDAMNYIDFNLTEDLSLNAIAEKISVNASYLSKQFKKENEKDADGLCEREESLYLVKISGRNRPAGAERSRACGNLRRKLFLQAV